MHDVIFRITHVFKQRKKEREKEKKKHDCTNVRLIQCRPFFCFFVISCEQKKKPTRRIPCGMDSRFNNETRAYIHFVWYEFPPPTGITIESMRIRAEVLHNKVNEKFIGTFQGVEEEKKVKINPTTEISITIYTPIDVKKDKLVIFYHGGGRVLNSRKTHQTMVNMLADATKSIWISVGYRLAPEHKFPIWFDDASEVARHIIDNKTIYGADETTKIGLAGDSAGASIAASLCHTLKKIDFQILVYGMFDYKPDRPSYKEFSKPEYILTPEVIEWFTVNSLRNDDDRKDPRAAVLLNKTFDGIPPCLFVVAELDPQRDHSYAYNEVLKKAGVKTELVLINGVIHSFFSLPGLFPEACQQTINAVREFMASL